MRSLFQSSFQSIVRFFQRLFQRPFQRPSQSSSQRREVESSATISPEAAALRRLIYQATCDLSCHKRTHAAQVGALLRQQDATFSYEKYNFTKLIDLLEAVPDLVALEKVDPDPENPNSAPVYYVRLVTDTGLLLRQSLQNLQSLQSLQSDDSTDGWVHLDSLQAAMQSQQSQSQQSQNQQSQRQQNQKQPYPSFLAQRYGYSAFKSFLESRLDLIEFKTDSPSYVRLIQRSSQPRLVPKPKRIIRKPAINNQSVNQLDGLKLDVPRLNEVNGSLVSIRRPVMPLSQFAGFSVEVLHQKVSELAAIALPENWYFGPQPPDIFAYPILKSYLRYTFIRLQHEGKVPTSANGQYRAFNTGLLDTLLRPIYALFTQSSSAVRALDFCIAGEGYAGKTLVAQFAQLPIAANYLENPNNVFYHLAAGAPQVDWQHVVKDNMARLPLTFLQQNGPLSFTPRSTQGLTTPDFFDYKGAFVEALEADPASYRRIVNKLEEALERTLKRIQVNYNTAVPTYYPKINSIDLLLPMCLADENTADLALVVRREASQKYIGHTILTMRQAYNNARLICKLDEHWLTRSMALSQEEFDEDEEEFETQEKALQSL